jgi:hypothetical protein
MIFSAAFGPQVIARLDENGRYSGGPNPRRSTNVLFPVLPRPFRTAAGGCVFIAVETLSGPEGQSYIGRLDATGALLWCRKYEYVDASRK